MVLLLIVRSSRRYETNRSDLEGVSPLGSRQEGFPTLPGAVISLTTGVKPLVVEFGHPVTVTGCTLGGFVFFVAHILTKECVLVDDLP